ncbi:MAG: helix-turn-helix transcriptional regulator [Luteolibacter sp.]
MKTLQAIPAEAVSIPPEMHQRIATIADTRHCSFEEALKDVITTGFQVINNTFEEFLTSATGSQLSPKQRDVLVGLRRGLAVKELASELKVSEVTVRTHIIRIRQRLGCSDLLRLRIPGE